MYSPPENRTDNKTRQYNPYQDLESYSHLQPLKTLYDLPTSPEFLCYEDALKKRRSTTENITFYTGTSYLLGAVTGGITGTLSGLRAAEAGESLKVRMSRVLSSGGHSGRKFGNNMGILGLIFAGLDSVVYDLKGEVDDGLNPVLAGLGTGVLFKAAAGPRSAAVAGALGGLAAGAAILGRNVMKRFMPNLPI
ncbi:mitochondrial import inner membrane translocase subunit TIM23-3 [Coffea eugenioides]|uniref:mitochondrial import inner membrane translocase subunit TIM23-3 n=1 Tax=Coffea eugenioides TaxID=49369 RepID=UPI000F6047B7|nr:mitochondrial import inner membrane translocase subunit TIM23-3 [Coffea eugenioides]